MEKLYQPEPMCISTKDPKNKELIDRIDLATKEVYFLLAKVLDKHSTQAEKEKTLPHDVYMYCVTQALQKLIGAHLIFMSKMTDRAINGFINDLVNDIYESEEKFKKDGTLN